MNVNGDLISYYASLAIMLARGTLFQIFRLRFRGWLFLGAGGKILGLGKVHFSGMIKVGAYSSIDARFSDGIFIGKRFSLGDFSILRASGATTFRSAEMRIGDNVSFGPYSNIGGGYGLQIGNDCLFGPYASIHPEEHSFSDPAMPIRLQGIFGRGIIIGPNNWFGAKTTILDGVRVSSGSVFGAKSLLVNGSFPKDSIFVGAPARRVKSRCVQ